jgi:hypothetical protein
MTVDYVAAQVKREREKIAWFKWTPQKTSSARHPCHLIMLIDFGVVDVQQLSIFCLRLDKYYEDYSGGVYHFIVNTMDMGDSMYAFHWLLNRAMVAPSITRWSPPHEICITCTSSTLSPTNLGTRCTRPMAPMATCGEDTIGDM